MSKRKKSRRKHKLKPRLIGTLPPSKSMKRYRARTYLAGPMREVRHSGSGWRTRLGKALLKRGIFAHDPVKTESTKTGLRASRIKKILKKLMVLIIRHHDRQAEKKFLEILDRIVSTDLKMVANSDFVIARVESGVLSGGTMVEIVDGSRSIYWKKDDLPKKKKPIYVLYSGKPKKFSTWLLYFILKSGGKVFLVKKNNGHKELLSYLDSKYDLEDCESKE